MTQDVLLSRIKEAAEKADVGGLRWMADHAPTDEVLAVEPNVGAVSVVAKVNPMAEWDDATAAAWTAFIALANPQNVRALIGEVERLRSFVAGDLQANFVEQGARVAEQAPWKAKAIAAEQEVERLREALRRIAAARLGVSGMTFAEANDWFNERARQSLQGTGE